MRKFLISILVCLQVVSLFSVCVFGYTVDDVRDLVGQERVDDKFTESEINTVIKQYEQIEYENMTLRLFAIGKELDIDSELLAEYDKLEADLEVAIDNFANNFESGEPLTDVLSSKSIVESILHKIESLRDIGYDIDVEYIPNVWTEKYEEVSKVIAEMNSYYDLGALGEGMKVPYVGTFRIYSPFGPRLNKFTYDSIENHMGLDFNIPLDTVVISQWNGVVSKIYSTDTMGKTVEISHGQNLKTVYSHLGNIKVKVGQRVSQYEAIGTTGNTGKMVTPHLHFGVYLDGKFVNPIYLYGSEGLMAFKTYASTYASANSQIREIESNLKSSPTKVVEEEKEKIDSPVVFVEEEPFNRNAFIENSIKIEDEDESKPVVEIPDGITLVD